MVGCGSLCLVIDCWWSPVTLSVSRSAHVHQPPSRLTADLDPVELGMMLNKPFWNAGDGKDLLYPADSLRISSENEEKIMYLTHLEKKKNGLVMGALGDTYT